MLLSEEGGREKRRAIVPYRKVGRRGGIFLGSQPRGLRHFLSCERGKLSLSLYG